MSGSDRAGPPRGGGRDPRLVTRRRGGLLQDSAHRDLALWAAACAEHVLALFQAQHRDDARPAAAVASACTWASGQTTVTEAPQAACAAHAAARESAGASAAAARAAGHAAATAHMADHELAAAADALRAVSLATEDTAAVEGERRWQVDRLPDPAGKPGADRRGDGV